MRIPSPADIHAHEIVFSHAVFTDTLDDYKAFVLRYWNESPENDDEAPLDFDWDLYRTLDHLDMLHLVVGRYTHRLVAAALYIIQRDAKRKYRTVALCDTFAVDRGWRGRGVGTRMMTYVESSLRMTTADVILNGYREVYEQVPLFERLGFTMFEKYYIKPIVRSARDTQE